MHSSIAVESAPSQKKIRQALSAWTLFFILAVLINDVIPLAFNLELRAWTYSPLKSVLFHFFIYAGLFLITPIILLKGWSEVRRPSFLIPLILGTAGIALAVVARPLATLAVVVLIYLHRKFDLSDLGLRSQGWKHDILAGVVLISITSAPALFDAAREPATFSQAMVAGLERLFANPASTVENLFYFGFLAERLSDKTGRYLSPLIIGLMYTAHEMTNPEYWYESVSFPMIFVGIAIWTTIYLWRRSVIVLWLGDGLSRAIRLLV